MAEIKRDTNGAYLVIDSAEFDDWIRQKVTEAGFSATDIRAVQSEFGKSLITNAAPDQICVLLNKL